MTFLGGQFPPIQRLPVIFLHPQTLGEHQANVDVGIRVPLRCRNPKTLKCFCIISLAAFSLGIKHAKDKIGMGDYFRIGARLGDYSFIPVLGFGKILLGAFFT